MSIISYFAAISMVLAFTSNVEAQEFSFVGRKPDLSGGKSLTVTKGVMPGIPLVFETTTPQQVTLRPAKPDEHSTPERAVYRFERQKVKSILFYELIDPKLLELLDSQNAKNTSTIEGKAYEKLVVMSFFNEGKTLQGCISNGTSGQGIITTYIKINTNGKQELALAIPEGGIAQCMLEITKSLTYPKPKNPFVAKASINVTE